MQLQPRRIDLLRGEFMSEINCEYCEEPLSGPDKFPFFGDLGFCSLDHVAEFADTCGRPIHREMLDWKTVAPSKLPFIAIGNDELGEPVGETATCPHCSEAHVVKYGETVNPDGTKTPSRLLGFVKCGEDSYLVAVAGQLMPPPRGKS
jgi:hypothetical protein